MVLREGLRKDYYENGVLKDKRFYKNDKLEGISKIYYPTGKLQVEVNFKDNEADGILESMMKQENN